MTAVAAAVALAVLAVAGVALTPPPGGGPVRAVPPDVLVQYGYVLRVPSGWVHTGGLPERRRSLLTPHGTPDGTDLISVERTPLGYDAVAEPERARAELRAEFDAAVAGGAPLADLDPTARFAGRPVLSYRQSTRAAVVDWYVVLDGDAQLSVGCQHTAVGAERVASACAVVVGSVGRG